MATKSKKGKDEVSAGGECACAPGSTALACGRARRAPRACGCPCHDENEHLRDYGTEYADE